MASCNDACPLFFINNLIHFLGIQSKNAFSHSWFVSLMLCISHDTFPPSENHTQGPPYSIHKGFPWLKHSTP